MLCFTESIVENSYGLNECRVEQGETGDGIGALRPSHPRQELRSTSAATIAILHPSIVALQSTRPILRLTSNRTCMYITIGASPTA
jgi:hypothetical protein